MRFLDVAKVYAQSGAGGMAAGSLGQASVAKPSPVRPRKNAMRFLDVAKVYAASGAAAMAASRSGARSSSSMAALWRRWRSRRRCNRRSGGESQHPDRLRFQQHVKAKSGEAARAR